MRNFILFLKSSVITGFCLLLLLVTYIGFCRVYESMRERLFDDTRGAVVIGDNYFKFFDKEFYLSRD